MFTAKYSQSFIGKLILAGILVLSAIGHAQGQGYETNSIDITEFSLTPSFIDTTASSQTVTVTLRAVSRNIDISTISLHFRSHTGLQFLSNLIKSQHLVSGNGRDGVYRIETVLPRYSKEGIWSVFAITAMANRNYRNFYDSDFAERGFATQFQVISHDEDTTPPELSDFSLTTEIDAINGSQKVTVTVRAIDTKLGVRNVSVGFSRPGDDYSLPVGMNRISGDDKDGIYQGVITFSRNTPSGIYNAHVFLADVLFNNKGFSSQELAVRGYISEVRVNLSTPTAPAPILLASVSIRGRVLTATNRAVSKAVVSLTESNGNVRYAATNPFGYYQFNNVKAGETYNFEVKHKHFSFIPQVLFVDKELSNLDFTGNNLSEN